MVLSAAAKWASAPSTTAGTAPSTSGRPLPAPRCQQRPASHVCRSSTPQYYPGVAEETDQASKAFASAHEASKPSQLRVPGLQAFAAAIWQRRRSIPSQSYVDPLLHLFEEFDRDNDGVLKSEEIAAAFKSSGVDITDEQVQFLIDVFEEDREHVIRREEWPEFVHSLAISDLHIKNHPPPNEPLSSDDM